MRACTPAPENDPLRQPGSGGRLARDRAAVAQLLRAVAFVGDEDAVFVDAGQPVREVSLLFVMGKGQPDLPPTDVAGVADHPAHLAADPGRREAAIALEGTAGARFVAKAGE